MGVTVSIHFLGLCFFARKGSKETHVLLPTSGIVHDGHQVEQHVARISTDEKGTHFEKLDHLAMEPITSDGGNTLPDKVANLSKLNGPSGLKVRGDVLKKRPSSDLLFAKFILEGGTLAPHGSALWMFEGKPICLSNHIVWTSSELTLPHDELTLTGCSMNGGSDRHFGPYKPDRNSRIELYVFSVPLSEIKSGAKTPEKGDPAHHFAAYHPLMVGNTNKLPIPYFEAKDCPSSRTEPFDIKGIVPVTCMAGGGDG